MKRVISTKRKKIAEDRNFIRLNARIHKEHAELMELLIRKRRGVSKKDIIYTALEDYFHGDVTGEGQSSHIIPGELAEIKKELRIIKFLQEVYLDAFTVFVQVWMTHTNDVPQEYEDAAVASMKRRFEQFKKLVLNELSSGSEFFAKIEKASSSKEQAEMGKDAMKSAA